MSLQNFTLIALTTILFAGCGTGVLPTSQTSGTAIRPEGNEKTYSSSTTYSGSTLQVQAQANYERFDDYSNGGAKTGTGVTSGDPEEQGLVTVETKPIRRAEVVILNASTGVQVQAGHTDNLGQINLTIPNVAGTYRIEVRSRAYNNYVKASILDNPYDKNYYSISATVTVGSGLSSGAIVTPAGGTMVAAHNSSLEGGAFNILEDILLANEYMRAHIGVNSASNQPDYCPSAICNETFTTAPKVQIYWTKGLSPAAYYDSPSSAISFFVSQSGGGLYEGLYILGGVEGSICTDTDHFDNSVILHEYGHFLESVYAGSDSPGGSHSGNKVIDPRLAWSEGWANFYQAAVLGRSIYRDTQRNSECDPVYSSSSGKYYTARLGFTDFDIENQSFGQDTPTKVGEGNFREISISRTLWDTITGATQNSPYGSAENNDAVSADLGFSVLWDAFKGLASSSIAGRQVGHLHQLLYNNLNSVSFGSSYINAWTDDSYSSNTKPLVKEKQRRDLRDFGLPLSPQSVTHGGCVANANLIGYSGPDWTFLTGGPVKDTTNGSGGVTYSNPFETNDFYRYDYDGTPAHAVIKLRYKKVSGGAGSAVPWDLDLYLYKKDFTFLDNTDILRTSDANYPETTNSGYSVTNGYDGYETINLTGLDAGTYFINVKAYYVGSVTAKGDTQYYLEHSAGEQLCP